MSEATTTGRFRSPPFPAIPLQKALERAEQLYRQERDHLVPIPSAAKAWGMSPTSSGPLITIGALKQYGLADDEGAGPGRKVRLTHDALRLVLDKVPNSAERQDALRRAFLAPKIFAEMWDNWKAELPSDQTIINYLVLERRLKQQAPFSEQSALELLANYRASLAFAGPQGGPNVSPPVEETGEIAEMPTATVQANRPDPVPPPNPTAPSATPTTHPSRTQMADNERVVFVEEGEPNQYLKVIASGDLDEIMLDALSDYINRQKRRLNRAN